MFDFLDSFNNPEFKFHTNILINSDIIIFMTLHINHRYEKMSLFMETLNMRQRAFYTDDMYEILFKIITSMLKIRKFIKKNLKKTLNESRYVNEFSLELNPLHKECIKLNINNNIYRFNTQNVIRLYKYGLYNIDEHYYLFGELTKIKNPYTNLPFTLKEHTILFLQLEKFYFKIKKLLPTYLYNFKNSYFDKNTYEIEYHNKLLFHSITSYLNNLRKNYFKTELRNIIQSSEFIKKRCCFNCLRKINIKENFLDSVRMYILNSNGIYTYGDYQETFINKCKLI